MSIPMQNNNNNIGSLQQMMQFSLLSKVQTGNTMIDTITTCLVMAIITQIMNMLPDIVNYIKYYVKLLVYKFYDYLIRTFNRKKVIDKHVEISYITDSKQINELYKAVHWFITNSSDINYLTEANLKFSYEDKIIGICKGVKINKNIYNHNTKDIRYKNHTIKYSKDSMLIDVYTDKDRKRENYVIYLSTPDIGGKLQI